MYLQILWTSRIGDCSGKEGVVLAQSITWQSTALLMPHCFPPRLFGDANSPLDELDAECVRYLGDHSGKFEYQDKEGVPIGPFALFA